MGMASLLDFRIHQWYWICHSALLFGQWYLCKEYLLYVNWTNLSIISYCFVLFLKLRLFTREKSFQKFISPSDWIILGLKAKKGRGTTLSLLFLLNNYFVLFWNINLHRFLSNFVCVHLIDSQDWFAISILCSSLSIICDYIDDSID